MWSLWLLLLFAPSALSFSLSLELFRCGNFHTCSRYQFINNIVYGRTSHTDLRSASRRRRVCVWYQSINVLQRRTRGRRLQASQEWEKFKLLISPIRCFEWQHSLQYILEMISVFFTRVWCVCMRYNERRPLCDFELFKLSDKRSSLCGFRTDFPPPQQCKLYSRETHSIGHLLNGRVWNGRLAVYNGGSLRESFALACATMLTSAILLWKRAARISDSWISEPSMCTY